MKWTIEESRTKVHLINLIFIGQEENEDGSTNNKC